MKVLIISQVFWPDEVSTSQHLTDLANELIKNGHEVSVICSRHAYEHPATTYPPFDDYNGVKIKRLKNTGLGKKNILTRLTDFFSFNFLLYFELKKIQRNQYDVILGMTSPPLVSYIGIKKALKRKIRFCYWAMDLQPELAIASGLLKANSFSAKALTKMGDFIIRNADTIIALDRYMKGHLENRGARNQSVKVIPVWPVIEKRYEGVHLDNPFRGEHKFGNKIVVMYSGNHAYVHPIDTLLKACLLLKDDSRFLFVFIGEGVRKKEVHQFKEKYNLDSILPLPYQPRSMIHLSLGSADLQVVIMGENQVGYTHPNKIYGALFLGKPVLYIGPPNSHVTDILNECPDNLMVAHGEAELLAQRLKKFADLSGEQREKIGKVNFDFAHNEFDPAYLKKRTVAAITGL